MRWYMMFCRMYRKELYISCFNEFILDVLIWNGMSIRLSFHFHFMDMLHAGIRLCSVDLQPITVIITVINLLETAIVCT